MGRLEVNIRHGGDGGRAAVIVLIVLIVLAIAGGAGHKALTRAAHDVLTVVEVTAWVIAGLAGAAVAAGAVLAGLRIRKALRAACARRAIAPPVITLTPEIPAARRLPAAGRPALDAPHTVRTWPLPGWWEEVRPRIGGDSDEHRPR